MLYLFPCTSRRNSFKCNLFVSDRLPLLYVNLPAAFLPQFCKPKYLLTAYLKLGVNEVFLCLNKIDSKDLRKGGSV
jgi:hypothetical protein